MCGIETVYYFGPEGPYRHPAPPLGSVCCQTYGMGFDRATERLSVAVHEAGHTLAAMILGFHVPSVAVTEPTRRRDCGHLYEITGGLDDDFRLYGGHIRDAMTVLLAGERAEDRWMRETGTWTQTRAFFAERGGLADRATGRGAMARLGVQMQFATSTVDSPDDRDYWRYVPLADQVLAPAWPQVLLLAERVAEAGCVSGDEAADACGIQNPAPRT
ncbi:zinc metalloprotease [Streptomyces hydrogenans]|uniref:hypothetical protein n=1 Tax=Streptomyces hydrogenans TaxID=1873719 RepID=UPI00380CA8A1